jgi:hypothetical protein
MYELTLIFLLALLFLIVYFIGMRQNRKIAVKYARAIKDYMSPRSDFVGFRPYSRGGFRAVCKMKENEPFTQIEMAVSLVDRENLMHYPLSFLTKDRDRFACWGFLKKPMPFNIEILPTKEEKICQRMAAEKNFKTVTIGSELNAFFTVLASDQESANKFLSSTRLQKCILQVKGQIKRLSLSEKESRIYLIGELKEITSLKSLIDVLTSCGEQAKKVA